MNIWGKIIGAFAGYALHGVGGAMIGAIAGHLVDMYTAWVNSRVASPRSPRQQGEDRRNAGARYSFTLCVVTLAAKLAKVDGTVSKVEIAAFKEVFRVPQDELANVGMMFDRARASSQGFESFARQLAQMFSTSHNTLDEVINCLFHVALADGALRPEETDFIRRVAKIFGFSDSYFQRRMEEQVYGHTSGGHSNGGGQRYQQQQRVTEKAVDPYALLGIAPGSTDLEIKTRHRKLVRENHPDSMVALGKTKAEIAAATDKLARINAAYDQIVKERQ